MRSASLSFLIVSDWGSVESASLGQLAATMALTTYPPFSLRTPHASQPSAVFALGDNFYPNGVSSPTDPRWRLWAKTFVAHTPPALHVPWYVAAGNHDYNYQAGAQPQFDFAFSEMNPGGLWRMHGAPSHDGDGKRVARQTVIDALRANQVVAAAQAVPPGIAAPPAATAPDAPSTDAAAAAHERLYYRFSLPLPPTPAAGVEASSSAQQHVDCFVINTCAAQWSVRRDFPDVAADWPGQMAWLAEGLRTSTAQWKLVFGHHPLYTAGRGHQDEARCLRSLHYTCVNDLGPKGRLHPGLGLEQVLLDGGADVFFAGHDHAFQHTRIPRHPAAAGPAAASPSAPSAGGGEPQPSAQPCLHNFVCGNSIEAWLWRGRYMPPVEEVPDLRFPPPTAAAQADPSVALDMHRSVCSADHHVETVVELPGVTHCDVTAAEIVVRMVAHNHTVPFECRIRKAL